MSKVNESRGDQPRSGHKRTAVTPVSGPETKVAAQNAPPCPTDAASKNLESPTVGLSDRQRAALMMILTGATDTAVAEALGANRKTIYRWRVQDPAFRQALDEERQKHFEHAADRMRGLLDRALDTLGRQVQDIYDPTSYRAAHTLLSLARVGHYIAQKAESNRRTPGP